MKTGIIDLARARRALVALDRLATNHPERCRQTGPKWTDNLEMLEEIMGTPATTRTQHYRDRLKAKGYKALMVYLPEAAHARLVALAKEAGLTQGDLIARALEHFEETAMNLAAISRQALARAKKARILHAPGMGYHGEHICVFAYDRNDRPMVLTGPDGALVLFATPLEADDALHALAPELPVEVDDFAARPPAQILP